MPTASYEDDPDLSRDDRIGWDQEQTRREARGGGRGEGVGREKKKREIQRRIVLIVCIR